MMHLDRTFRLFERYIKSGILAQTYQVASDVRSPGHVFVTYWVGNTTKFKQGS